MEVMWRVSGIVSCMTVEFSYETYEYPVFYGTHATA